MFGKKWRDEGAIDYRSAAYHRSVERALVFLKLHPKHREKCEISNLLFSAFLFAINCEYIHVVICLLSPILADHLLWIPKIPGSKDIDRKFKIPDVWKKWRNEGATEYRSVIYVSIEKISIESSKFGMFGKNGGMKERPNIGVLYTVR
ncbi:hypothetical protein Y032_0004g2235 [Ancylostoma ceylanicum]|uniref:Uncharacterized protein n=1 Tax=Ancylostoma ceylanicum TaxID=53326 RepID=A0A016VWB8_9BILA|nr:hypothetical protein Y032_0004g2235 [Ancylostoma ceylanicum]